MRTLSVDEIIGASCAVLRVSRDALEGPGRQAPLVFARHMTMLALRRIVHLKLEAIGATFGGRSHASVIHGIRSAEEMVQASPQARAILVEIQRHAMGNVDVEQIAA